MASQARGRADGLVVGRARGDRRRRSRPTCWSTPSPACTVGTTFQPSGAGCRRASCGSPSPARSTGTVTVDDGARRALVERGRVAAAGRRHRGQRRRSTRATSSRSATRRTSCSPAGMVAQSTPRAPPDRRQAHDAISPRRRPRGHPPRRPRRSSDCRRRRIRYALSWSAAVPGCSAGNVGAARRRCAEPRRLGRWRRRRGRARRAAR